MKRALAGRTIAATGLLLLLAWPRPLIAESQRPDPDLPPPSLTALSPAAAAGVAEAFGGLPLHFEANLGQTDDRVRFLSRGRGYTLFLTPSEAVMALQPATSDDHPPTVLRWSLAGADPNAPVRGLDELPGKSNYFIGNDPSAWRTDVPTYGKVAYDNVYPGIDLVYYGNQNRLEYDFVVAPGADPKAVQLAFEGASPLVDSNGDLTLAAGHGEVRLQKPHIYQEVAGMRRPVSGGFLVQSQGAQVGFQLDNYDSTLPLIIDPVLDYSTYLGGTGAEAGAGIAMDGTGNVYVTGSTSSGADFPGKNGLPPPDNKVPPSGTGAVDGFVVMLSSAGTLVYSTYFGGTGDDRAAGIAVSSSLGTVYVSGYTSSADFPKTPNAYDQTFNGGTDAFLLTLAPNGMLQYGTFLGGTRDDRAAAVAVDSDSGVIYLTGTTHSSDFPAKNAFQAALSGDTNDGIARDAFVAKLDISNPNPADHLVYATYMGGASSDDGFGILAAGSFDTFVTGQTCGNIPFPVAPFSSAKAFATVNNGGCDAFLVHVTEAPLFSGQAALAYSTYLGSGSWDLARSISFAGPFGGILVTGETFTNTSIPFPTKNAFQSQHQGGTYDVFVAVLSAGEGGPTGACNTLGGGVAYNNCNDLRSATYLGGSGDDHGYAVAADMSGAIYVAGQTCSGNFPPEKPLSKDTVNHVNDGTSCDAFVTKFNPTGSGLAYSTYLGGALSDIGAGIVVDIFGAAYVTGTTASSNFPQHQASLQPVGGQDAFVAKLATPCIGGGAFAYTLPNVIDTAGNCLAAVIPGTGGTGVAVHPDGARVFTSGFQTVSFIDPVSKLVTQQTFGGALQGVAVSPDGTRLYVTEHNDGVPSYVHVFNTQTEQFVESISFGADDASGSVGGAGVVVHPDGKKLYVLNNHGAQPVVMIDLTTKQSKPIPLPGLATNFTRWAIAVTPDGKWVYTANGNQNDSVSVIDTSTDTWVKNLPIAIDDDTVDTNVEPLDGAFHIAITPKKVPPYDYLVYVTAEFGNDNLTVIDTATHEIVHVEPGAGEGAVAVTPDGMKVYVVTAAGGSAKVIDVATNKWVDTVAPAGYVSLGLFIGPQDRDGDGIIDQIDGTYNAGFVPNTASSDDFTDKHLGGASSGKIVARNGLKVTVWDAFNPAGFYAKARGGAGTAEIKACGQLADQSDGQPISLTANDVVKPVCGSLTLEVIQGPVEVGLGGGTQAVVPTGGAIKVTQVSPGQFQVDNLGNTPITIVNAQGQVLAVVGPGVSQTITVVAVDIKPGSGVNPIGCRAANGSVPVAVLSDTSFDATTLDADSVRFGKTGMEAAEEHKGRDGKAQRHVEDVNKDGRLDMVFHFRLGDTGFRCSDIPPGQKSASFTGNLTGQTGSGTLIAGSDSVLLVGGE